MSAPARTVDVATALPWGRAGEPDVGALGRELRLLWIIEEVRQHRLGVGKGAELAGVPRAAFMHMLGDHGVPVIDYTVEELDRELGALGLG
jgi:predicted HTH domain antitoxin